MFLTYILITAAAFLIVVFVIFLKSRSGGESVDSTLKKDGMLDESSFEVFEVQLSKNEEMEVSPTRASLAAVFSYSRVTTVMTPPTRSEPRPQPSIMSWEGTDISPSRNGAAMRLKERRSQRTMTRAMERSFRKWRFRRRNPQVVA